jgi:hypothetical protein
MRTNLRTLAYIALIAVASPLAIAQEPSSKPFLIRDVTVIDLAGHGSQRDI